MSSEAENSTVPFVDPSESIEKQDYGFVGVLVGWVFRLGGFVFNCIIWDAMRSLQNPAPTLLWIKHTAVWCNLFLALRITLGASGLFFSLDLESLSRLSCKAVKVLDMFLSFNPNSLVTASYLESALFLSYPTWHYNQNWKRLILKCSVVFPALVFLYSLPLIAAIDIRNGSCEIISQTAHVELSLTICTDLWAFFPWGSVKIVPLLRKDNCRSARIFTDVQGFSVQIFQEIFFHCMCCIFGLLQQVF